MKVSNPGHERAINLQTHRGGDLCLTGATGRRKLRRDLLALILLAPMILAWTAGLRAQGAEMSFKRFALEQGLSQDSVICLLQDRRGFLRSYVNALGILILNTGVGFRGSPALLMIQAPADAIVMERAALALARDRVSLARTWFA